MRARPPACARCGYDLTGIGAGEGWATCPECGHVFDPARPYPRPWPHPARLALMVVSAPTLLVLALLVVAWLAETAGPLVRVAGVVLVPFLVGAIVLVPLYVAWRIAAVHALRYERPLIWVFLAVVGEAYALGLAFAAMLVGSLIR